METTFYSKIVGTTFIKNSHELLSNLKTGDKLILKRDKNNIYDPNAIIVLNTNNQKIGFIPKQTAASLAKDIDSGKKCECYVNEITGWQYNNLGCNIKLTLN
jgi:hypothetical protein